jgi:hypothetical protein
VREGGSEGRREEGDDRQVMNREVQGGKGTKG